MKKILCLVLTIALLISSFVFQTAFAEDDIKVLVNGKSLTMDQPPVLVNDRTLVPVRAIFEALGAKVDWNNDTNTATGVLGGTTVEIQIENTVAKVNGKDVTLDVPAKLISDRTLVPVRFISESLGAKVDWDNDTQTVIITTEDSSNEILNLTFDDLSSFEANKDFIMGGGYDPKSITLSSEADHTTGSGKSIKLANRTSASHRIKFKDAFSGAQKGDEYTVSAYVYTLEDVDGIGMGLYGDVGTSTAFSPVKVATVNTKAKEWTKVELSYKYDNEEITQIGFDQKNVEVPVVSVIYIDDVKVEKVKKENDGSLLNLTFDNLSSFEVNSDFITGAAYDPKNVSLSSEVDHTTGSGKSLKMDGRTLTNHRVKIKNAFDGIKKGDECIITAYVYTPEAADGIGIGVYGDIGTSTAFSAVRSTMVSTKAKEWTKIELKYTYDNEEITQIGIDQRDMKASVAPVIYIDDIKVEKTNSGSPDSSSSLKSVEVKDGHRPVPTSFSTGKSYDDLIYYEYEKTPADKVGEGVVIADDTEFLKKATANNEYGTISVIDVEGQPFKKAAKAVITKVPDVPYNFQIDMGNILEGKAKSGDICLLKIYMRTISGGDDEAQNGQIQPIIEDKTTFDKRVNGYVTSGSSWNAAYFPFIYETGYVRATVRLGFFVQDIEIGGYEIRNYGSDVKVSDLPGAVTEYDTLSKDAAWRKDAWDRIEKIRKGDIKVIVKDASGNAVSNAKVDVNMYEHEFEFGTAVNSGIITSDAMAGALQQNFNTAVLENDTKCNYYLKNPQNARNLYEKCLNVGIKNLRGHVLFWDRNYMDRQEYEDNSAISEELWNLEKKGNKEEIQNYIKNHINTITADMAKYGVKEWDVLNEACNNKLLQDKFGKEIINEWFNMARESLGNDGMLYYNDFTTNEDLFTLLDTMVKNNVDFDGIGIQSHYRSVVNLEEVIDFYNRLDKYGKRLKITEYDYHALGDEILQGNYTRDILIASFAQESVDGFILWGFKGGPDSKYVLYDDDWNEKPGLKEWQDLVYNKWWTQESGTTSSDGSFSTRGFYGDYDITVTTADGKTKKVSVPCRKGSDNTITITLD